jgi:cytochrome c biogenesis protein CcdA
VLRESLLLLYCAAVGFVAAGIAASLYKMATKEPPKFRLLGQGWVAVATTFMFCALTGPAIIVDLVLKTRFAERGAVPMALVGLVVAIVWSACSGILVLGLVLTVRDGLA